MLGSFGCLLLLREQGEYFLEQHVLLHVLLLCRSFLLLAGIDILTNANLVAFLEQIPTHLLLLGLVILSNLVHQLVHLVQLSLLVWSLKVLRVQHVQFLNQFVCVWLRLLQSVHVNAQFTKLLFGMCLEFRLGHFLPVHGFNHLLLSVILDKVGQKLLHVLVLFR